MALSNSPAKVTVSASALPTGAAADGTDISSPTAMPTGGAGIRGWLSAIWTKLNGTLTVTGSGTAGTAATGVQTVQGISGGVAQNVAQATAANLNNTATQGPANTVGNAWPVKNTDGTNTATVKAASTAAAAGDSGLVVALHPTSPLPAGTAVIGALSANQSVNNAQVNAAAVVTSVTGVQDVMPRKRTGATGLSPNYTANRITTKTTTNITAATAYISTIVIACSAAGTSATLTILDKSATPKTIVPVFTLTVPTTGIPIVINFDEPILSTGGIDVTTAGTTMGTVDVYVTYWQ